MSSELKVNWGLAGEIVQPEATGESSDAPKEPNDDEMRKKMTEAAQGVNWKGDGDTLVDDPEEDERTPNSGMPSEEEIIKTIQGIDWVESSGIPQEQEIAHDGERIAYVKKIAAAIHNLLGHLLEPFETNDEEKPKQDATKEQQPIKNAESKPGWSFNSGVTHYWDGKSFKNIHSEPKTDNKSKTGTLNNNIPSNTTAEGQNQQKNKTEKKDEEAKEFIPTPEGELREQIIASFIDEKENEETESSKPEDEIGVEPKKQKPIIETLRQKKGQFDKNAGLSKTPEKKEPGDATEPETAKGETVGNGEKAKQVRKKYEDYAYSNNLSYREAMDILNSIDHTLSEISKKEGFEGYCWYLERAIDKEANGENNKVSEALKDLEEVF